MAVMRNSIIFGGVDSADFGIYIGGEGTFNAPKRDVEMISIPGRNGAFALDKGRFENIEVTYSAFNFEPDMDTFSAQLEAFRNAICSQKGYQRLTDTFHPDEYRMAAYIDGLEIKPVNFNTASTFDIVFDCKPQRFLTSGEEPITIGEWRETETASGSIATFEAVETDAVKSLVADIEPTQSLNGYDKPWSGGAGKNKLYTSVDTPYSQNGVTISSDNGNIKVVANNASGYPFTKVGTVSASFPSGSYYLMYSTTISGIDFRLVDRTVTPPTVLPRASNGLVEIPSGHNELTAEITITGASLANGTYIVNCGLMTENIGYQPYSNICPISGHDEVNVSVCGVNLLDAPRLFDDGDYYSTNADGSITVNYSDVRSWSDAPQMLLKAGTYTMSRSNTSGIVQIRDVIGEAWVAYMGDGVATSTFTLTKPTYIAIRLCASASSYPLTVNAQLELGTTSTDYEPYNGTTYNVSFGTAGTVYGGTLDVVSGVLMVTDENIASYNGETLPSTWISDRDVYASGTTPTTGAQVVYKLATPTTVQLTAQEVELLVGTNNVWNDCGDTTVEYGTAPNVVINPTPFESSPMLEAEGYGGIGVNGDVITIQNGELGEIKISDATQEEDVILNVSNLNANDAIYSASSQLPYATMSLKLADASGTLNVAKRSSVTGGNAYISKINGYASEIRMSPVTTGGLSFRMGWSHTYTTTLPLTITINGTATNCTLTLTTVYNGGTNTISLVFGGSDFPESGLRITSKYSHPVYYGNSTKVVLPSPMYIDLDLGEAYGEVSDEITSFNGIVQMPANPPTLKAGANEINFDNTITDLKVIPRWWKI